MHHLRLRRVPTLLVSGCLALSLSLPLAGCGEKPGEAPAGAKSGGEPEKANPEKAAPKRVAEAAADEKADNTPAPTPPPPTARWRLSALATSEKAPHGKSARFEMTLIPKGEDYTVKITRPAQGALPALSGEATGRMSRGDGEVDTKTSTSMSISTTLAGGEVKLPMLLELRFEADEVSGYWAYTGKEHVTPVEGAEGAVEHGVYGALLGAKGAGASVALDASTKLPCVTCCNVTARCGAQGPGACNSSMTCLGECLEEAGAPKATACLAEQ